MFNFSILKEKFENIEIINNSKVIVYDQLQQILEYLKQTVEFDLDMLTSIVAVDNNNNIELIYQLMSSSTSETLSVSFTTDNFTAPSLVSLYSSSYFDECEIFDLFGVNFIGNDNLKRLLMPENWSGHPLLKSYIQNDERLVWND